jgi:hypothetical protein
MPIVHVPEADEPIEVPADAIEIGEDEEIDNSDLPSRLHTESHLQTVLQKRLSRKERTMREDLKDDDEFFQTAAEERGIELREDGHPKGSLKDEELQELKKKAGKAESLEDEVEELRADRQRYRRSQAWTQFREHAPDIREGAEEDVKAAFFRRIDYDPDDGFIAVGDDGEPRFESGDTMGIGGVADELSDEKSFMFASTEATGGSPASPSPNTSGDTLTQAEFEKEVEKAAAAGDDDRLDELEEMMADGKIE